MRRVTDSRTGELRIPADRFPLPARVEELLRIYSGLGRWEGSPHAPGSVAIFELPVYRLRKSRRRCWRTSPATISAS